MAKMKMPPLKVRGTTFVLTGAMWTVRADIEAAIYRKGGSVASTVVGRRVLVVSGSMLRRTSNGKWEPHGSKSTRKIEQAIERGALVYHEAALKDALLATSIKHGVTNPVASKTQLRPVAPKKVKAPELPQWSDALMARMKETTALLEDLA